MIEAFCFLIFLVSTRRCRPGYQCGEDVCVSRNICSLCHPPFPRRDRDSTIKSSCAYTSQLEKWLFWFQYLLLSEFFIFCPTSVFCNGFRKSITMDPRFLALRPIRSWETLGCSRIWGKMNFLDLMLSRTESNVLTKSIWDKKWTVSCTEDTIPPRVLLPGCAGTLHITKMFSRRCIKRWWEYVGRTWTAMWPMNKRTSWTTWIGCSESIRLIAPVLAMQRSFQNDMGTGEFQIHSTGFELLIAIDWHTIPASANISIASCSRTLACLIRTDSSGKSAPKDTRTTMYRYLLESKAASDRSSQSSTRKSWLLIWSGTKKWNRDCCSTGQSHVSR